MKNLIKMGSMVAIPVVGALALASCGGGGGSADVAVATPAATTLAGTAAKGLIRQATVLVCRIVNGAPEPDTSCASGTTADDGSFTVRMSDGYTGPAMIKIVAAPASMMQDETTGTAISYNMTMRAVVPAIGGTAPIYVTPFSEMAAQSVGTSAIDADRMRQAIATVQTTMASLGVDLSVRPVVDLQNSGSDAATLGMQSNMVKQLTRVMLAARNASTITDANGVACNAAGTSVSQQVACVTAAMARVMTGPGSADPTRAAAVISALTSQNVTAAYMPIVKPDGTLDMELADMTSSASMQAAMDRAGMSTAVSSTTVGGMMQRMR